MQLPIGSDPSDPPKVPTGGASRTTTITATTVKDPSGFVLFQGLLQFNTGNLPVFNGAVSPSNNVIVTPGIGTFTVTDASGANVILEIPNVAITGSTWSFDSYSVPAGTNINGRGAPTINAADGAVYQQLDGSMQQWTRISGVWVVGSISQGSGVTEDVTVSHGVSDVTLHFVNGSYKGHS